MKVIKEDQIKDLVNILAEFPAKHVINAILMLNNLPDAPKQQEAKPE